MLNIIVVVDYIIININFFVNIVDDAGSLITTLWFPKKKTSLKNQNAK